MTSFVLLGAVLPRSADASGLDPFAVLRPQLAALAAHAPGHVALLVRDIATGVSTGVNAMANMPAASTIKIPVMVEVFRQMEAGAFDLDREVTLEPSDRDWGWGDLANAAPGGRYTVSRLLWLMITNSDNTATNMLIRLVGRAHINATMKHLGLRETVVGDYIRSDGDIRSLRSSPRDLASLLDAMAHDTLIDEWSSREMISILAGQRHNSLLPAPLPSGIEIAHKTGSLHDTLNDVGIVFLKNEPYIIAVMTTQLPTLDAGRTFIRSVSRLAYDAFLPLTHESAIPDVLTPDQRMWDHSTASAAPDDTSTAPADANLGPAPASAPQIETRPL